LFVEQFDSSIQYQKKRLGYLSIYRYR